MFKKYVYYYALTEQCNIEFNRKLLIFSKHGFIVKKYCFAQKGIHGYHSALLTLLINNEKEEQIIEELLKDPKPPVLVPLPIDDTLEDVDSARMTIS